MLDLEGIHEALSPVVRPHNHLRVCFNTTISLHTYKLCTNIDSFAGRFISLQEQRAQESLSLWNHALLPELSVSDNAQHYVPAPRPHSLVTTCMLWLPSTSLSCKNTASVCTWGLPLWRTWCPPWHFMAANGFPVSTLKWEVKDLSGFNALFTQSRFYRKHSLFSSLFFPPDWKKNIPDWKWCFPFCKLSTYKDKLVTIKTGELKVSECDSR